MHCIALQRIRGAPHVVWVGRVVIGHKSDQTFRSALSVVEPHFWGENRSPPRLPPFLGELVDRSGHGSAGVVFSWLVCPSAHGPRLCCFWVCRGRPSLRALSARRNCLVSFGGLVERRLAVRRRRAPLVGRWEWGLGEETPTSWGRLPLASSYSPGGLGVVVQSPGRRSGPTLPHREAKVSGVGSP